MPEPLWPGPMGSDRVAPAATAEPAAACGKDSGRQAPDSMDFGKVALIFLAVAVPNMVLFACFSGIGKGLEIFNLVAPFSLYGDVAFGAAALMAATLYILDWPNWPQACRACSLLMPWALGVFGTVLKGRKYPWGPMLMCIVLELICLGALRAGPCRTSNRIYFFRATYIAMFFFGLVMSLLWGSWVGGGMNWNLALEEEWAHQSRPIYEYAYKNRALAYGGDCSHSKDLSSLSLEERADVKKACTSAGTVLFMVWACPFIGAVCNFACGIFICLNSVVHRINEEQLEQNMKKILMVFTFLVMGMYGSTSLSSTSLRLGSTMMAFFLAGLVALLGWVYLEVGKRAITLQVEKSRWAKMYQKASESDWVKAMFIGALNVVLIVLYCLEKARQQLKRLAHRSPGGCPEDRVTDRTKEVMQKFAALNWASVLCKICILGEVFFVFQVGVAKATYVFLSWMNGVLAAYSFGLVAAVIFAIGYVMFLLPPVPGVPVYVFCGVVIGDQGRRTASVGFVRGCLIAVALAWVLKLSACCGQYAIGALLGRSVKVQQLIGVDRVPTRAIQQILERRGLDPGKVAVLVGGPDWPVSVTCGILRLSVPQMLLGTAPVLFVLAPCVLAGAFLSRVTGGEESLWNMLAQVFMSASVAGQMGSMFMAVYTMTSVMEKDGRELELPRREHEAVEELTRHEEAYNQAYAEVTRWQRLHGARKLVVLAAASLMLLSGFVFAFLDELCFENFSVSGKIADPLDENGLDGNALNIVKVPMGVGALALFAVAALLHAAFTKGAARLARRELAMVGR